MRVIFLIAVVMVGYLLYRLYFQRLWQQGKPGQVKIALVGLGIVFLALAVTGRAPAIFALIGAAMTQAMRFAPLLLRFAPQLRRYLGGMTGAGSAAYGAGDGRDDGRRSRVETPSLVMTLDHETGAIDGVVKVDRWQGRTLESLDIAELRAFRRYCLDRDGEALRLLDTYLARARADEWEPDAATDGGAPPSDDTPSVKEAYGILGLEPGASRDAVVKAHRTLMGRLHPDKGGSTWLASKVNAAKRIVLDDIEQRRSE